MRVGNLFVNGIKAVATGAMFAFLLLPSSARAQSEDALCVLECAENGSACFRIITRDSKTCALGCAAMVKAELRKCRDSADRRACLVAAKDLGRQCLVACKDDLNSNARECVSAGELCVQTCDLPNQGCLRDCRAGFITCALPVRDQLIGCSRDCKTDAAPLLGECRGAPNPAECAREVWQRLVGCHADCRVDARSNLGSCLGEAVDCGRRCLTNR